MVILFSMMIILFRLDWVGEASSQQQSGIINDLMDLSKYDLVHDSELIIVGNLSDRSSAGTVDESQTRAPENLTKVPGIRNTIQIEKILKGSYEGSTIDVITEDDLSGKIVIEGSAKLQRGEKIILFLYQEPLFSHIFPFSSLPYKGL